ncbi:MAG: type II toxin-antitoxin system VapC family toxin [Coriobacteriales bacterium]|jgi:predicted nucleic acid-binding protein|nr:type II toxin-antitoxin system VapC family toxin [Coriobacteriales bacterium]
MTEAYLDTSALVRLLHAECYSEDLEAYIRDNSIVLCTSDLSRTEVIKALGLAHYNEKALTRFFSDITVYPINTADFEEAGKVGLEDNLRSLDAIHIQMAIRHVLPVFITYDKRQLDVAGKSGMKVVSPGMM